MSWNIFPHQILIGNSYFDPTVNRIRKVWFSTGDIYKIFDDFDSFGIVFSPSTVEQAVIPKMIGKREIPFGSKPKLAYFAGRTKFLSTQLPFGKFEVLNSTLHSTSSRDARIEAHIWLQLEFEQPTDLKFCLQRVREIGQFLSIVAGRSQGIERLQIEVDGEVNGTLPLDVHWILGPQQSDEEQYMPSWFDMPLDGVRQSEEFASVIQKWFTLDTHKAARVTLYSCLKDGNSFTPYRLVAAANLFDLTSMDSSSAISPELEQAKQECLKILQSAPPSYDRDSAIQGIQRIGSLTLLKKILSRAQVLHGHFLLPDLDKILRQAVLFRNYFVHGPGDTRFKFAIVEPHRIFLTKTLEFVFTAAELIECGWAASSWHSRGHTDHHWFTRYLSDYERASQSLLDALEQKKKK